MTYDPQQWPQGYLQWTGTFEQLVDEATRILAVVSPTSKPPTARTLRHYQHSNVLGRGAKKGRTAVFNCDDLTAVVTAKNLVKSGWTLTNTASLRNSAPANMANVAAIYASPTPNTAVSSSAVNAVAQLMAQSQAHVSYGVLAQSAPTLPPSAVVRGLSVAPWITVYLDEAAASKAQLSARQDAATQLQQLAQHILNLPSSSV